MTRLQTVASSVLALSLALPVTAAAQRRGGGESGGGGSAGGRTSSEPSVGTAQPRSAPAPSSPSPSSPSGDRGSSPSSVRDSGSPRNSPRASGSVTRGAGGSSSAARSRDERVIRGTAQARTGAINRGGSNGGGYYYYDYPWYSRGSSYGYYGYYGLYSPYYYNRFGLNWGGYGYNAWHDPFLYDPYSSFGGPWPYYWGPSSYGGGSSVRIDRERDDDVDMGAIRLRVSPRLAKVYVDGALAGVVDEFDGLTSHLRLPAGKHQIELRADGYESTSLDVTVERGKTRTERASLKQR